MKKTTAHGRKLKRTGGDYNGVEWINAISRCQPYTDELIPGAIGTTQASADKSIALVADAFRALKSGSTPPDDADDFNRLAHALGISELRAEAIGGEAGKALLPILATGNAALGKVKARREKWGKWELLPAEVEAVFDALAHYEEILLASSPAQMADAVDKRMEWLRLREADALQAVGATRSDFDNQTSRFRTAGGHS